MKNSKDIITTKKENINPELNLVLKQPEIELFVDQKKIGYAKIYDSQRWRNIPIKSEEFSHYVRHIIHKKSGKSINDRKLKEIIGWMDAEALFGQQKKDVFNRVSWNGDSILYNLANEKGEFVEISKEGWVIKENKECPIYFKEPHSLPQVRPLEGGNLADIFKVINVKEYASKLLYLCILCTRMIEGIAHPIVYVHGSAGSGKTEILKKSKELLDPCRIGVGSFPHKIEDYTIQIDQQWVVAFDNVGRISNELSDALARTCTGDAKPTRQLYTTDTLKIMKAKNPLFLNGININAKKSDLLQRTIMVETCLLREGERKSVRELDHEFQIKKPYLLGAIFTALSKAMRIKEQMPPIDEFRLADFAEWGASCAMALGYSFEDFIQTYRENADRRAHEAIIATSAGRAIMSYFKENSFFQGITSEFMNQLFSHGYEGRDPQHLGSTLAELENSLAQLGIFIEKRHIDRGTEITIQRNPNSDSDF